MNVPDILGIIAGNGVYPRLLAAAARKAGVEKIAAAAFTGETDPVLQKHVDVIEWMRIGQLGRLLKFFREQDIHHAIMAGQIAPKNLFDLRPDLKALMLMGKLKQRNAESIFAAIADELAKIDVDLLGFITNVAIEADPGLTPSAVRQKYAAAHEQISHILVPVETAAAALEETSADGPARAAWYDLIVEGAGAAARSLAIPLTIGGDRDHNPHDTPFVRLIMGLEALLPPKMQSRSLAACAKRIERSPASRSTR